MKKPSQYRTARLLLGITTVVGVIAVVAGAAVAVYVQALLPMAIGIAVAINGVMIIAAAQMGSAALDTAVSTRETADLLADLLRELAAAEVAKPRQTSGLRAMR